MTTIRVGAEQFRRQLTDLLNRVSYGGDEVIVERNGRPLVILKQYEEVDQVTELSQNQIERTRTLAEELETARLNAGISYEELARALRLERLRTLREKYPDFAAQFAEELSEEQADATTTAGA